MIPKEDLEYNTRTGMFNTQDRKKTAKKFQIGGKMGYIGSINKLLDLLTKNELKLILKWFSEDTSPTNLLEKSFTKLTPEMDRFARSKFKRKLINNLIIAEHKNRIMLNPYIFAPTSTSHNYSHLTQGLWKYLFEDKDTTNDEIIFHEDDVFGLPDILTTKSTK